ARHVERDAAVGRADVALERSAGAEGDHRHALRVAQLHHFADFGGAFRIHHRVGRIALRKGFAAAVLLAQRGAGAAALAEDFLQPRNHRLHQAVVDRAHEAMTQDASAPASLAAPAAAVARGMLASERSKWAVIAAPAPMASPAQTRS